MTQPNTETGAMASNRGAGTLSVEEAHEAIGKRNISRGGLYAAINRGEVPNLRLGKRILIPRHAFLRWLEAGTPAAVR